MQLIKTNTIVSNEMLKIYKQRIMSYVNLYKETKSMINILKEFSIEDIERTVESIYVINGIIQSPSNSRQDYLLRLLQYGGKNVKALNILSLASVGLEGSII